MTAKNNETSAYQKLIDLGTELQMVKDTQALLGWDQEVLLPQKGVPYRGRQMSWLSGFLHRRLTDPKVGEWISEAEQAADNSLDEAARANLREWRHGYDRATKVPAELVEEMAEAQVVAKSAWAAAREKSQFEKFAPHLHKLIDLNRQHAECWGYQDCIYDALLDTYERGITTSDLDRILGDLKKDLVPLVKEADSREPFDRKKLQARYPIEEQEKFNRKVAEDIGFDFDAGRIDTAVHPFCSGMAPNDVRMTTRYDECDFLSSLFGVLHEAGHGMYEQGLNGELRGQPVGDSVSLGIHESQSRLWENHVGRSRAFWKKWLPVATEHFPNLAALSVEEMFRAVNQAERSFIRVEADEVTYDLHILLRYELEKAIFAGELAVKDLPGEWNRKMDELFGLKVENDANGCLQDIHWSMGAFGYFPTYSLGNINAAHLAKAARSGNPALAGQMDDGDYSGLLQWLREKIHHQGSLYLPEALIERATGSPATADALIEHLRDRYLPI